jgi:hypothetical protein
LVPRELLDNELRGSDHDPRDESECARIHQDVKDESDHCGAPHTQAQAPNLVAALRPLLKHGGKVTARGRPKLRAAVSR